MGPGPNRSAPSSAKAELHETTSISTRLPPQLLPPKLAIGRSVSGGT